LHRGRPFFQTILIIIHLISFPLLLLSIKLADINDHNRMKYTDKLLNQCLPIPLRFVRITSNAEIDATVAYSQSL